MSSGPAAAAPLVARALAVTRGRREIIPGLDLELREGEIAALLGPNGAGKSTLLEALAGLLPPLRGSVERRGRVALALQSPDLARRTAAANIELALAWWGVDRAARRDRARDALAAMQAGHLGDRPAAALSGGERRRVHLARAVSVRPDVLLLDEPFAGLDLAARAALLDDTGSALRAFTRTALVVVHERAEAWALADRLLVMVDGKLVADAPPRELIERPPGPEVATFLGFDGRLEEEDGVLLTRAHQVELDPNGPLEACVTRTIPTEDGVRLELSLSSGVLYALHPLPGPGAGERLRLRLTGGVRFRRRPGAQEPTAVPAEAAHSASP